MQTPQFQHVNEVLPFAVPQLDVRGRIVKLTHEVNTILKRHDYPDAVSEQLGKALVLTILVGSSMKFQGRFIVQAHTKGAIELLVCEYRSDGSIRGYAKFDPDAVSKQGITNILGTGTLALTVDQGLHTERYQGVVLIEEAGLEHAAQTYFKQSEQIPSEIKLSAAQVTQRIDGHMKTSWVVGGILAQHMPAGEIKPYDLDDGRGMSKEDTNEEWFEAIALLNTLGDDEILDQTIPSEDVIYRLFHERSPEKYETKLIFDNCGCSEQRIAAAMGGMSEAELDDVFHDGPAEVQCEFCSTQYRISRESLP